MLREYQKLIDRIQIGINGLIVAIAFVPWYWWKVYFVIPQNPFSGYFNIVALIAILVMAILSIRDFSLSSRIISPSTILKQILISDTIAATAFVFFSYLLTLPNPGRRFLLGGIGTAMAMQIAYDMSIHWLYRKFRALGYNYRNVLLIGNQHTLPPVIETLASNPAWGLNICGYLTLSNTDRMHHFPRVRSLGTIKDMEDVLDSHVVDYVILTVYRQMPQECEDAMLACYERGIEIWLKPDFMQQQVAISRVDYMDTLPLLVFFQGPSSGLATMAKRGIDIVGALVLLILLSLPMAIAAGIILCFEGRPILFKQTRVGMHGRKFPIYKFRTMTSKTRGNIKLKNELTGPIFKMENDPRVTAFGRFLRKYSLDELPQLWNVVVGDMSLIGPRPPTPEEVDLYRGWHRRRLSMRPGITGLWQVKGRNDIKRFDQRAKLDLKYIDAWSLWLDFKISLWTIPQVLKGTGS